MRNRPLLFCLVGLLLLGFLLGSYEGIWKQGAKKVITTEFSSTQDDLNRVNVEVVWDASGSMWGREEGIEKIIRSKKVLKTVTGNIPDNINIGLRIFGARRVGDVNDSFLAVPISKNNEDKIINFITNVKPLGKSPIGLSLKKAKDDLISVEGRKIILLVSDGIENGKIPAQKVVDELKNNNIILNIVFVGNLDNKNLKQNLKDISHYTGGNYFTYKENNQIVPAMTQF